MLSFSRLFKVFIVVSSILFYLGATTDRALAQGDGVSGVIYADGEEKLYENIQLFVPGLDIRRTALNHLAAAAFDGIPFIAFGKNISEMQGCGAKFLQDNGADVTCQGCAQNLECEDLQLLYKPGSQFAQTRVAGTLIGLSNFLGGAAINEPAPVNLAYWWNDNVNKVPFVGHALAADSTTYSGPFLGAILFVWKLTRNIAYGLMSVVMLATGLMIITRKKLGPQAAVTAQLALPKIIIALVLITFSYPIGALGVSLAYVLRGNVGPMLADVDWGGLGNNVLTATDGFSVGFIASALFAVVTAIMGLGPVILIISLLVIFVAIVAGILVYIKFFTIYIKLLFSIIAAPFIFTIGAIPGQDQATINWFKSFIANVIAIPAMFFIYTLSFLLSWKIMLTAFTEATVFGGGPLMLFIVPFVYIYGAFFARQVPDKIEALIVGEKKRK